MEEIEHETPGEAPDELTTLREENALLVRQLDEQKAALSDMQTSAAARESEIAALREASDSLMRDKAGLAACMDEAVEAFRELVLESSPGLPAELVTGGTIAEIRGSAASARDMVEKVRREMEAENARQRVPAGSPPRSAPDVTALSPREKIRFALGAGAVQP